MIGKIKKAFVVHALSMYLLWPMLPLVFGCLWGIDFGYANTVTFILLPHCDVAVPSIVMWLFSPVTFFVTLPLSLDDCSSGVIHFPEIYCCLKGRWTGFSASTAATGWLVAYALTMIATVAIKIGSGAHTVVVFGKKRPLSLCLWVACCAGSLLSLFLCKGDGPYSENEFEVVEALNQGNTAPNEEKCGYRFVTARLAVPLKYGWGNRGRTFCRVSMRYDPNAYPPEERFGTGEQEEIWMKDTKGEIESLPEIIPPDPYTGRIQWDYARKLGWVSSIFLED